MKSHYLDNNATTALDESVIEGMLAFLRGAPANPSSLHRFGRRARSAIDSARQQVADLVDVAPEQVIFTGSGTEANNLAIKGFAARCRQPGRILASQIEHPSVLEPIRTLTRAGWQSMLFGVNPDSSFSESAFRQCLSEEVKFVALMLANNETGAIMDTAKCKAMLESVADAPLLVDAIQAAGKIPLSFDDVRADFMSLSAHKLQGPKGIGALIVRPGQDFGALIDGGGQEHGYRSGTENVAGIVGFGIAAENARKGLAERMSKMQDLTAYLDERIAGMKVIHELGDAPKRLPNTRLLAIQGMDGETVQMALDRAGVAISSGSACSSGKIRESHVVRAMNVPQEWAGNAIRVSVGPQNTTDDIDALVAGLHSLLTQLPSESTWDFPEDGA